MLAIRRGVQEAVFRLGRVTEFHQMDHSSAATHELSTGSRGFNDEYRSFVERLGMKPRSIEVDEPHQNGDVESLNGAFKRRLKQHLLLRGSRDFASEQEYERWVQEIAEKANEVLYIEDLGEYLTAILAVVPLQLLAYHIATLKGTDVDQPRNLAKSVTVE